MWCGILVGTTLIAFTSTSCRTAPDSPTGPPGEQAVTASVAAPSYVSNQLCLQCHPHQGRQWAGSNHFKAFARATEDTVSGDFDNATFEHRGVTSLFFKRGARFFVRTEGTEGAAEFEIKYTIGVEPLQQYLIELPGGRMQALTIAWDTKHTRWFHLYPDDTAGPGDVLHWTGRYQNWNTMCAACHSTNIVKGYDAATDTYRTTWSEINVSCQSCHGPGERHVAWAGQRAANPSLQPVMGERYGLVVNFGAGDANSEIEACAPCHARRSQLTVAPSPGEPLMDNYLPDLISEGLYHADGQQRDEVYVFGSFRQSKMYAAGVRCSDCHDPHSGAPRVMGNGLCTRCHGQPPDARFPSAAAKTYDSRSHHFHAPGTPGAQCVSCHMPATTYMTLDERQDHSLRIPRPDLTVSIGTPNACTGCHKDRPASWAAAAVKRWYGNRRPSHYGEVLAAARAGKQSARNELVALSEDRSRPAIIRATALDLLRKYAADGAPGAAAFLRDPDPAVRVAAVDSFGGSTLGDRVEAVGPLLSDPVRAVRLAAARVLSGVPRDQLDLVQRKVLDDAVAELIAAQSLHFDLPGPNVNVAVVYESTGRDELAEAHYAKALRLDPDFTAARVNLAQLYSKQSRNADAESVLRDGLRRQPTHGDLHYLLGLLLAEENRLPEAEVALGTAVKLHPDRARFRYNHALTLNQLGRAEQAEAALVDAARLDPRDPAILYALATVYAQHRKWRQALVWAEKLEAIDGGDPQTKQLLERVREGVVTEPRAPRPSGASTSPSSSDATNRGATSTTSSTRR